MTLHHFENPSFLALYVMCDISNYASERKDM